MQKASPPLPYQEVFVQFREKEIVLKNGKKVLLCSPTAKDARDMLDFLMISAGESEFTLCYPEERAVGEMTEMQILESVFNSPYDMMISCFSDGKIVATAQISFFRNRKTAHRATLSLAVLKDFWGLGIGTALMQEMEIKAKTRCITQLELSYMEGNERGKLLYEKLGFSAVAEKPGAYRLADGRLKSEIFMIKFL